MVGVAQLVERWIVIPVVVGSIPIVHPIFFEGALIVRSGAFFVFRGGCGVHVLGVLAPARSSAARVALDLAGAESVMANSLKISWRTTFLSNRISPLAILW